MIESYEKRWSRGKNYEILRENRESETERANAGDETLKFGDLNRGKDLPAKVHRESDK